MHTLLSGSFASRLLSILLLSLCFGTYAPESTAQSMWGTPFDSPEEQQDEEPSPYGTWATPQQDEARNGWTTDDPWNTRDPWGLDQEEGSWGESDWARDFYDFEDENGGSGSGSARRVGGGITMTVNDGSRARGASCIANNQCSSGVCCPSSETNTGGECGKSNGQQCPGTAPGNSGGGNRAPIDDGTFIPGPGEAPVDKSLCEGTRPLPEECRTFCENSGTCTQADVVPLPGLVYLLLAGLGYGGYKLREETAGA